MTLWLRIAAGLTLVALALMVWSVLVPTPLPVMVAMLAVNLRGSFMCARDAIRHFLGADKAGSIGRPMWGIEMTVADDAGNPVPIGEPGEIARLTEDHDSGLPRYYYGPFDHYISPAWSRPGFAPSGWRRSQKIPRTAGTSDRSTERPWNTPRAVCIRSGGIGGRRSGATRRSGSVTASTSGNRVNCISAVSRRLASANPAGPWAPNLESFPDR